MTPAQLDQPASRWHKSMCESNEFVCTFGSGGGSARKSCWERGIWSMKFGGLHWNCLRRLEMWIICEIREEQAYGHTGIVSALGQAGSQTAEAGASDGVGRPVGLPTGKGTALSIFNKTLDMKSRFPDSLDAPARVPEAAWDLEAAARVLEQDEDLGGDICKEGKCNRLKTAFSDHLCEPYAFWDWSVITIVTLLDLICPDPSWSGWSHWSNPIQLIWSDSLIWDYPIAQSKQWLIKNVFNIVCSRPLHFGSFCGKVWLAQMCDMCH